MRNDNTLVAIAIMVLAGAVSAGLGHIAGEGGHTENFPQLFGSGLMLIGSIVFVAYLARSGGAPRREE